MARALKPALALCCALVLCVGAVMTLDEGRNPGMTDMSEPNVMMASRAAGSEAEPTAQPMTLADVPKGSISMSAGMKRTGGSLFAQSTDAGFPLVTLGGATYRMLESPDGISSALLGKSMGAVNEFNMEPALGSSGVVSNVIAMGVGHKNKVRIYLVSVCCSQWISREEGIRQHLIFAVIQQEAGVS